MMQNSRQRLEPIGDQVSIYLNFNSSPLCQGSSMTFSTYSRREIELMSVKELTNAKTFDEFGHSIAGGLHDLALGPPEEGGTRDCITCNRFASDCNGHVGHITLAAPCMNPTFFQTIIMVCG